MYEYDVAKIVLALLIKTVSDCCDICHVCPALHIWRVCPALHIWRVCPALNIWRVCPALHIWRVCPALHICIPIWLLGKILKMYRFLERKNISRTRQGKQFKIPFWPVGKKEEVMTFKRAALAEFYTQSVTPAEHNVCPKFEKIAQKSIGWSHLLYKVYEYIQYVYR